MEEDGLGMGWEADGSSDTTLEPSNDTPFINGSTMDNMYSFVVCLLSLRRRKKYNM